MSTTGTEPPRASAAPPAPTATAPKQQRVGSARDMAGRKREYETIYILRPTAPAT